MQLILDAIEQVGGIYVVTADHGNAEDMVKRDKSGKPQLKDGQVQILTSHTLEPVSFTTKYIQSLAELHMNYKSVYLLENLILFFVF